MAALTLDVEKIVSEVARFLSAKSIEDPHDVFVWSDGRVTPFEPQHTEKQSHLVTSFGPADRALPLAAIRESVVRGLAVAPPAEGPPDAVTAGPVEHPREDSQ